MLYVLVQRKDWYTFAQLPQAYACSKILRYLYALTLRSSCKACKQCTCSDRNFQGVLLDRVDWCAVCNAKCPAGTGQCGWSSRSLWRSLWLSSAGWVGPSHLVRLDYMWSQFWVLAPQAGAASLGSSNRQVCKTMHAEAICLTINVVQPVAPLGYSMSVPM